MASSWIWSDNAAEATLLIAFALPSPEVTGDGFLKAKGNPEKRYYYYFIGFPPLLPPQFLMALRTA